MIRIRYLAPLLAASALTLSIATPAMAGKTDRAREAIAAAQAKIDAAQAVGATADTPHQVAMAKAELARAKEDFSSLHQDEAIEAAIHASALADAAIGDAQKHKDAAIAAERHDKIDAVNTAQDQASRAQAEAAEANARAASAQQMSANASAQAASDRAIAAAAMDHHDQQVETTVTTQQDAAPAPRAVVHRKVTRKRVIHRKVRVHAAPAAMTRTTTTVTTH